jgi:hypothetical protein
VGTSTVEMLIASTRSLASSACTSSVLPWVTKRQDLLIFGLRDDPLEPRADVYQPVGGLPVKTAN